MADEEEPVELVEHLQETPVVAYDTPDTNVLELFRDHPDSSVAVLNDDGTILGVIEARDIL